MADRAPHLVLALLVALLALGLIALGAYWWYSYAGLYRWLAELQIKVIGAYYPTYTGIFTILLLLVLPLLGVVAVIHQITGAHPMEPHSSITSGGQADNWIQNNTFSLSLFVLSLVSLGIGGYNLISSWTAGKRTPVALADLEAGKAPPSRWVLLDGTPLTDRGLMQGDRHGGRDDKGRPLGTYYIPLVSPDWNRQQPVSTFVKVHARRLDEVKLPLEGTLKTNGLPGPIRAIFEEKGPSPTSPHYVLEYMMLPDESAGIGWVCLSIGGGLLLVAVIVWTVKALANRRDRRPD